MIEVRDPKELYFLIEKAKSVAKEGHKEWIKLQDVLLSAVVDMVIFQCRENMKVQEVRKMTYGQMLISTMSMLQNIVGMMRVPSFAGAVFDKAVKALGDEVSINECEV